MSPRALLAAVVLVSADLAFAQGTKAAGFPDRIA